MTCAFPLMERQLSTATAKPRRARYACGIELPRVANARTRDARHFRALVESFAAEIGPDELTGADKNLITQAAALSLHIERLQLRIVEGQDVSTDEVVRLSSELRRVLSTLRRKAVESKQPDVRQSVEDLFAVADDDGEVDIE
jgi:hypothetical protein